MYSKRKVARRRWPIILKLLLACFISAGVVFLLWLFLVKGSTKISDAKNSAVIKAVKAEQISVKNLEKPTYTLQLPDEWTEIKPDDGATHEWQSTRKGYENRWLKVYVDTIPLKKELNKVMPIEAKDNRITHGVVSENCREFTALDKKVGERALEQAPSVFQKVPFVCDLAKRRNVVGTSSISGGYKTTIVGESGNAHSYFFIYTDHSSRPDYEIFINALDSFTAL